MAKNGKNCCFLRNFLFFKKMMKKWVKKWAKKMLELQILETTRIAHFWLFFWLKIDEKMAKICKKWPLKISPKNGQKWSKMAKNGPKMVKMGHFWTLFFLIFPKSAQNGVKNVPFFKVIARGLNREMDIFHQNFPLFEIYFSKVTRGSGCGNG